MQRISEWVEGAASRKIYVHQRGKCWRCNENRSLPDMLLSDLKLLCRQCHILLRIESIKSERVRTTKKKRKRKKRRR